MNFRDSCIRVLVPFDHPGDRKTIKATCGRDCAATANAGAQLRNDGVVPRGDTKRDETLGELRRQHIEPDQPKYLPSAGFAGRGWKHTREAAPLAVTPTRPEMVTMGSSAGSTSAGTRVGTNLHGNQVSVHKAITTAERVAATEATQ